MWPMNQNELGVVVVWLVSLVYVQTQAPSLWSTSLDGPLQIRVSL